MNRTPVSSSSGRSSSPTAVAPAAQAVEEGARVVALARDSEVIYAYWDIPSDALTRARGRLGHGALIGRLVLRAHDVTDPASGAERGAFLEYDVSDSDRDAFIRVVKPGTAQIVEIGLSGDDGSFASIARSGKVELPRAIPSTWEAPRPSELRWMNAPPPPPAYAAPAPATVRDMALGAPPVVSAAAPPAWQPDVVSPTTRATGTSPLVGWGRPGPLGPGASEAWSMAPSRSEARTSPVAPATSSSGVDDLHVRAPIASRADVEPRSGGVPAAGTSTTGRTHEAHVQAAVDPGRAATAPEPPSASVDIRARQPSAAEGVWSPAEVGEVRAAPSPGSALERRQLPVAVPTSSTAVTVAKATTPPGWDQIASGLGALVRGVVQVTGGALRVTGGVARLGAWAVQKALEALRKPRS